DVFATTKGTIGRLRAGPGGRLYAGETITRDDAERQRLVAFSPEGKKTVLADEFEVGDLAITRAGGVYFLGAGSAEGTDESKGGLYLLAPEGKPKLLLDDVPANSLALSPDGGT